MDGKAYVEFINKDRNESAELEIPLDITANDLAIALNQAFHLEMDTDNIFNCYLVSENPIAFLRGNRTLQSFGIRNGSTVIFRSRK